MAATAKSVVRATHVAAFTANTADTITVTGPKIGIEVKNRAASGGNDLFVRADGTAATVSGDDCYIVSPGEAYAFPVPTGAPAVVSLISAGTGAYSVTAVTQ